MIFPLHAGFEPTLSRCLISMLEVGTFSVGVNPLLEDCLSGLSISSN